MQIFGHIDGPVLGDFVRIDKTHNSALVELLLGTQAKKTLDIVKASDRRIIIFKGKDGDGEYMGWRTVRTPQSATGLEVVAEHVV